MKKYYLILAYLCSFNFSYSQLTVNANATNGNVCLGNSSTLSAVATPIGYTVTAITTGPSATPGSNVLAENGALGSFPLSSGNLDDGRWDNISLPFSFRFFGNVFNSVNISTNGWVGLGSTSSTTTGLNMPIPSGGAPNNVIHAITSDLTFGGGPTNIAVLEYFQEGFPPNRKFIINYGDVKFLSTPGLANVQVILYETSNVIEIHTTNCTNTAVLKSQGIENNTGTTGYAAPGRNSIANWGITSGSPSYRFTPDNITYTWSPGGSLNTTTGASVIATPSSNTTYTVTALNTVNSQTANNTVTVNVNPASYTLAAVAGGPQICQNISVAAGGTYYRDGTCNLISTLLPSGGSPLTNSVNTCTQVDMVVTMRGTSDLYVARKYDIEPILNPATSTATVNLYFLQNEFDNYNLKASDSGHHDLPSGPSDASAIANLRLHQFHGTGSNPLNYTGGQVIFSTATTGFTVTWNATRTWWEVTVPVNGFSGFYLTSEKLSPMPIKLEYFNGSQNGKDHLLNWKAVCLATDAKFSIERSSDGQNFIEINTIAADQIRCEQSFSFTDKNTLSGNNYYRIKMTDIDGVSKVSNVILLTQKLRPFEILSLNPNIIREESSTLKVNAIYETDLIIMITDNSGRTVQKRTVRLATGYNTVNINVSKLPAGTYQITGVTAGEDPQTIQFIKQ